MKKAVVFSILAFLLFNIMGYYYLFELDKHLVKKEMQAMIEQNPSELKILRIADIQNNRDFQRIDSKEFKYKGDIYDIVREIKTGQMTVFICLPDAREAKLFAGLKKAAQNKLHFAVWDHLILFPPQKPFTGPDPSSCSELIFPRIDVSLISSLLSTWSPPPELS